MIQIFSIPALEAAVSGLEGDVNRLKTISDDATRRIKAATGKENTGTYVPSYIDARCDEIRLDVINRSAQLYGDALQRADQIIKQERHWTREAVLRRVRLISKPASFPVGDDSYLLATDKAVRDALNGQAEVLGEIAESLARENLRAELARMSSADFIAVCALAFEDGDLGTLRQCQLALSDRPDRDAGPIRQAASAWMHVPLPDADKANQLIARAKQLQLSLKTLGELLTARSQEARTWVAKVLAAAEHDEAIARIQRVTKLNA